MKKIAKVFTKISLAAAIKAAGEASQWAAHQPKEPIELKKYLKK